MHVQHNARAPGTTWQLLSTSINFMLLWGRKCKVSGTNVTHVLRHVHPAHRSAILCQGLDMDAQAIVTSFLKLRRYDARRTHLLFPFTKASPPPPHYMPATQVSFFVPGIGLTGKRCGQIKPNPNPKLLILWRTCLRMGKLQWSLDRL